MKSPIRQFCFLTILLIVFAGGLSSCEKSTQNSNDSVSNANISEANSNQVDIPNSELKPEIKSLETANLEKAELKRNNNLWERRKIRNYKMIVTTNGFMMHFGDPVEVEIESAKVKSVRFLTPSKHSSVEIYDDYNSVEKLFEFLEYELSRKPDVLRVSFDEKLGYPVQIALDEKIGMSDDEFSVNVKNLEITNKG